MVPLASHWQVLVLLGGERTLCDEIWDGVEGEREACFLALVRESGLKELLEVLLKNARNIALGRNCPERLFALLDMFTTVRELKPHVSTGPGPTPCPDARGPSRPLPRAAQPCPCRLAGPS